jgi:hypothetical protein
MVSVLTRSTQMKIKLGNMWSCYSDVDNFLVTTNSIVKYDGALVMGAGIAKQCRDKFPGIDKLIGSAIKKKGRVYGLLLGRKVGLFQVKLHFKDLASIELISMSTDMLNVYARENPTKQIALNFPGIGNGNMSDHYDEILGILSVLPDNVSVWKFK